MYKPEGYTDVSPYLVIEDVGACLDFLSRVFASERLRIHRAEDGRYVHAEARIGDSIVMMGEAPGGPDAHLHVYVQDAGAAFERAVAAGAAVVQDFAERDDGDIRGGVRDVNGTTWWLGRRK